MSTTATATRRASRLAASRDRRVNFLSRGIQRARDDAETTRAGAPSVAVAITLSRTGYAIDRSIDRAQRDSIVADARANATHRFVDAFTVVNFLPKTADCVRDAMIDRCVERARARCEVARARDRDERHARIARADDLRDPHV